MKKKDIISLLLFIPIGTAISVGMGMLLNYLSQQYGWAMSDSAIRYTSIIVSCLLGLKIAKYLTSLFVR